MRWWRVIVFSDDEDRLQHTLATWDAGGRAELSYQDVIITRYRPQERER